MNEVLTEDEKKQCLDIRREVFGEELQRNRLSQKGDVSAKDGFDSQSTLFLCIENGTNRPVGTLRITKAVHFHEFPDYIDEYRLDIIPQGLWEKTAVVTRLAVIREFRASIPSLLLFMKAYEYLTEKGYLISDITCEPNLFPMYRRLGFRPLGRIHSSPFGGFRLPLYMLLYDFEHFRKVNSPLFRSACKKEFHVSSACVDWHNDFLQKNEPDEIGFSLLEGPVYESLYCSLMDNLSEKGTEGLMSHAVVVDCNRGDVIISKGGGENNIGIIRRGSVEVNKDGKLVAVLGEGDIIGEIAFILDIPRTADVVAATPDTQVILLSPKAVRRIVSKEDQIQFYQNLSKILAVKLIATA